MNNNTKKKNLSYAFKSRPFAGEVVIDKVTGKKRVQLSSPLWYQHEVNQFNIGDKVTVEITNKKPKRTEQQNRYYRGVYLPLIAKSTGEYDLEYLHQRFKEEFLVRGTKEVFGSVTKIYGSTTELSVSEFTDFIMNIHVMTGVEPPPTENYDLAPLKKLA